MKACHGRYTANDAECDGGLDAAYRDPGNGSHVRPVCPERSACQRVTSGQPLVTPQSLVRQPTPASPASPALPAIPQGVPFPFPQGAPTPHQVPMAVPPFGAAPAMTPPRASGLPALPGIPAPAPAAPAAQQNPLALPFGQPPALQPPMFPQGQPPQNGMPQYPGAPLWGNGAVMMPSFLSAQEQQGTLGFRLVSDLSRSLGKALGMQFATFWDHNRLL